MRAMWSGSISFGLVNIPIKLYSGSESATTDLDMLRKGDLCSIKYLKVCRDDNKEVPAGEIVKGYQYAKGEYVVIEESDFERLRQEKSHLIDILNFVEEREIDCRYFEKPYYLEPERSGTKAYALLREALRRSGRVGIASYVLRNRANLGVLKPLDDLLLLNEIRYATQVRSFSELNLPEAEKIRDQEVKLALTLIDQLSVPFDPASYHDTYREELEALVEEKVSHAEIKPAPKAAPKAQVIDLMSLLKESLKKTEKKAA